MSGKGKLEKKRENGGFKLYGGFCKTVEALTKVFFKTMFWAVLRLFKCFETKDKLSTLAYHQKAILHIWNTREIFKRYKESLWEWHRPDVPISLSQHHSIGAWIDLAFCSRTEPEYLLSFKKIEINLSSLGYISGFCLVHLVQGFTFAPGRGSPMGFSGSGIWLILWPGLGILKEKGDEIRDYSYNRDMGFGDFN